jgi:predicted enzyme related to lactoylglutathione lyase
LLLFNPAAFFLSLDKTTVADLTKEHSYPLSQGENMAKSIFWFEIPAESIDRAISFYSEIFGTPLQKMEVNEGYPMAMLPESIGGGGAIVQGDIYKPTDGGVLIYLNVGDQFDSIYAKIESAGGKISMPKHDMGDYGYSAFFIDSEGNKIGLAAEKK